MVEQSNSLLPCFLQALSQQQGLQAFNDLTQLGDVMRLSSRGEHGMPVELSVVEAQ